MPSRIWGIVVSGVPINVKGPVLLLEDGGALLDEDERPIGLNNHFGNYTVATTLADSDLFYTVGSGGSRSVTWATLKVRL